MPLSEDEQRRLDEIERALHVSAETFCFSGDVGLDGRAEQGDLDFVPAVLVA